MNTEGVEHEFLEILRKTCRTMRQARNRPEMAIPAAQWELKINERMQELETGTVKKESEHQAA